MRTITAQAPVVIEGNLLLEVADPVEFAESPPMREALTSIIADLAGVHTGRVLVTVAVDQSRRLGVRRLQAGGSVRVGYHVTAPASEEPHARAALAALTAEVLLGMIWNVLPGQTALGTAPQPAPAAAPEEREVELWLVAVGTAGGLACLVFTVASYCLCRNCGQTWQSYRQTPQGGEHRLRIAGQEHACRWRRRGGRGAGAPQRPPEEASPRGRTHIKWEFDEEAVLQGLSQLPTPPERSRWRFGLFR